MCISVKRLKTGEITYRVVTGLNMSAIMGTLIRHGQQLRQKLQSRKRVFEKTFAEKAWSDWDITHFDTNNKVLKMCSAPDLRRVDSMLVEFQHQKNFQNLQKILWLQIRKVK